MKKFVTSFVLLVVLIGCSNSNNEVEPDSPTNAGILMEFQIANNNFNAFQSMFYEGAEENVSANEFNGFTQMANGSTNYKTYELLTFDNGEMLLVEFAPKSKSDDEYKIVNVKEVPDDMKALFEK